MRRIEYGFSFAVVLTAALATFGTGVVLQTILNGSGLQAAQQSDSERLRELRALVEKEIGTPGASEAAQCKLIAFGAKPCGGPAEYLVYSTAKTDEARLKQLVNEFNQLAKKINQEQKILSDCMFVTEPKVGLVGGICTIQRN